MTTIEQLQLLLSAKPKELSPGIVHKSILPKVECADGTTMSVQASRFHYCTPRLDRGPYSQVEVWCIEGPNDPKPTEFDYSIDEPSAYVDIESVAAFIDKHGGIKPTT